MSIELREDDLGYDNSSFLINVSTVPPTIEPGKFYPDLAAGINEGDDVIFDLFEFDDIAYDEPTETFEYQIDWGDGTVTEWMDTFRFTEELSGYGGPGIKILYVTESAPPGGTDAWYWNWLNAQKATYGWQVTSASWSSSPKFDDYDLIAISCNSATTYNRWNTVQTQMLDKGLRIMVVGNQAQEMLEPGRLNLANDANHGYGGFYFNYIRGNYAGITTGYPIASRQNMCNSGTGGSISGSTLCGTGHPNAGAFDGQHLLSVYTGASYNFAQQSVWTVWDVKNKTLSGNPLGTRIGFYGQYFSAANPTWTTAWNTMMSRTVNWLLSGLGAKPIIVEKDVSSLASASTNGRKMVMDSNDNMYIAYTNDSGPNKIQVSVSDTLGETWTMYQVTTDSASRGQDQLEPSLAIDSKDVLHAVWRGRTTSNSKYNIRYANSADGGKTWGNFKMVTTGSGIADANYAPAIAMDSNDNAHIVWHGKSSSMKAMYNIFYASRTSKGTWSSISAVTEDTSNMYHQYPSIATDSNNNLHVVWYGLTSSSSKYNIQYSEFNSTTSKWSSTGMLTGSVTDSQYNPNIAVDLKDNIHVVWYSMPSPTKIKYLKWDASTKTWGSEEYVSSNPYNNTMPSVGVDFRGHVYVAWVKKDPFYAINFSVNDGVGWLDEMPISGDMLGVWNPSLMYGGEHSIVARGIALTFTGDFNGTGYNLYMSKTSDFNVTDFGPWKGIPRFKHVYPDDNPPGTERDIYDLTFRIRDDDMGTTEFSTQFQIRNVLPEITSDVSFATGEESKLMLPSVEFIDPGTGPNEKWHYWWDLNLNGYL
ncbi:MAG: sialidase family protein, partial [Planctomycetota bacterium]